MNQCISYSTSPSVRCPNETEHKFCHKHRARLSLAPNYKAIDKNLDHVDVAAKSTCNLMKLYQTVVLAAEARRAFIEKMVCNECRDYGHSKRIFVLLELLKTIETTLEARFAPAEALPTEVEVPSREEVPPTSYPALRKRGELTRRKVEEWRQETEKAISDSLRELDELERRLSGVIVNLGYPKELIYVLGDLRCRLGGRAIVGLPMQPTDSSGKNYRKWEIFERVNRYQATAKWEPRMSSYRYTPPESNFERCRRMCLGFLETAMSAEELMNVPRSVYIQLDMALAILKAPEGVLVCPLSEGAVAIYPFGDYVYSITSGYGIFHRNIVKGLAPVPKDPYPGTTYLEGLTHLRSLDVTPKTLKTLNLSIAPRIARRAEVISRFTIKPLAARERLEDELDAYLSV